MSQAVSGSDGDAGVCAGACACAEQELARAVTAEETANLFMCRYGRYLCLWVFVDGFARAPANCCSEVLMRTPGCSVRRDLICNK